MRISDWSSDVCSSDLGMQGNRRFFVDVVGEDAHSGTTPLSRRKDAFVAATDMARALRDLFHDPADVLRFTIGRFQASPSATVVVPGPVSFPVDFRPSPGSSPRSLWHRGAPVVPQPRAPGAAA